VALVLRDWIPRIIQYAEPFVSSHDIYAGNRWQSDVASELEKSNFGLICVTQANQAAPWLNFEAGALAKVVEASRVVPLAIDLNLSDIKQPLGQFQAKPFTETGVRQTIDSINAAFTPAVKNTVLEKTFKMFWPELAQEIQTVIQASSETPPVVAKVTRTERDLLEEVLATVRSLARATQPQSERRAGMSPQRVMAAERELLSFIQAFVAPHAVNRWQYTLNPRQKEITIQSAQPIPLSVRRKLTEQAAGMEINLTIPRKPRRTKKDS